MMQWKYPLLQRGLDVAAVRRRSRGRRWRNCRIQVGQQNCLKLRGTLDIDGEESIHGKAEWAKGVQRGRIAGIAPEAPGCTRAARVDAWSVRDARAGRGLALTPWLRNPPGSFPPGSSPPGSSPQRPEPSLHVGEGSEPLLRHVERARSASSVPLSRRDCPPALYCPCAARLYSSRSPQRRRYVACTRNQHRSTARGEPDRDAA